MYVFKRDLFQDRNKTEAQSSELVVPDDLVEVSGEDLLGEIEIIDK